MRKSATWVQVIGLAVVAVFSSCRGGADHAAPTYGGDLWGGPGSPATGSADGTGSPSTGSTSIST